MKPIDKVAWIYVTERKVLGVQSKGKDTFFTPGGKREKNETDEETLVREVKEELSVDIIPGSLRHLTTITAQAYGQPKGVFVEIKCYGADFTGELKPNSEIEKLGWLTSAHLPQLGIPFQMIIKWLKERDLID